MHGWRADDTTTLSALRTLYSYEPQWAGRATGWLYEPDRDWPAVLAQRGPKWLSDLKADTGLTFTVACFQAYLNGSGVGWHADRNWGAQAILSLGVTRSFGLRNADGERFLKLEHGDLLVMPPGFQDEWEHCVPVEDAPGERCSLVFRGPVSN